MRKASGFEHRLAKPWLAFMSRQGCVMFAMPGGVDVGSDPEKVEEIDFDNPHAEIGAQCGECGTWCAGGIGDCGRR